MEKNGLTQQEIAVRAGIRQQSVQYLLTRAKKGSTHTAKLAAALGVSAAWLADNKGNPYDKTVAASRQTKTPNHIADGGAIYATTLTDTLPGDAPLEQTAEAFAAKLRMAAKKGKITRDQLDILNRTLDNFQLP